MIDRAGCTGVLPATGIRPVLLAQGCKAIQ